MDEAIGAYVKWREECAEVWNAYRRWSASEGDKSLLANVAYLAALYREEVAAAAYARVIQTGVSA